MRDAKFAGLFYEKLESSLNQQITKCFLDERGPGALPSEAKNQNIKAIIAPHAGYSYSGPCAAWSYKDLGEMEMPDLFILIGPSHTSNQSGYSNETFVTPFGFTRVDQQFARELGEKGSIKQNEAIHVDEHSLEVQIPFLQFIYKKQIEKIKILPMLIGEDTDLSKLALDLKETIVDTGKKVVFIISSDFTHYGRDYHYAPFSDNIKQRIYDLDGKAIDHIKNQDEKEFSKYVYDTMMTLCGALPISLLLKTVNAKDVKLNQYYVSGDLANNYKNSVSYASLTFR